MDVVAGATELSKSSVAQYMRVCREAGLITSTGARGVNAAPMTHLDAARLLLALLVTDRPARAAEEVAEFGALSHALGGAGARLDQALAELLKEVGNGVVKQAVVEVRASAVAASIFRDGQESVFANAFLASLVERAGSAAGVLSLTEAEIQEASQASAEPYLTAFLRNSSPIKVTRSVDVDVLAEIAGAFRGGEG